MLSTSAAGENSSTIVPELTGRPPDPPSLTNQDPGPIQALSSKNSPNQPQPMNFRAALTGASTASPSKATQWTFVGTNDLEPSSFQGEPALKISPALKERLCQPWKKTLIVRLLGKSVSYSYLCSQLRWNWRPVGSLDIMDLNNDTFLATFGNDQDYLRALTGGPWVILDHYLMVHQWSPNFRTSDKPHRSVVAWVQLPELPVHFYHREVLFALGNLIGGTIRLDYHTEQLERGKFARLAVELDISKPLPTRIFLDNFWKGILYENLPTICYSCGRIGHDEDACPLKKQETSLALITLSSADSPVAEQSSSPEPPAGFGPWMQVTRRSRKQIRKGRIGQGSTEETSQMARADSGKISVPTKGKQESIMIKGKQNAGRVTEMTKGKEKLDQKQGQQKGKTSKQKGKGLMGETNANGNKKEGTTQEWRAVTGKATNRINSIQAQGANPMNISDPSSSDPTKTDIMQTEETRTDQTHQEIGEVPQLLHIVQAQNNTTITVVQVPPLETAGKENRDPNLEGTSIRQHYSKQRQNRSPNQEKQRVFNLRGTKKPLQIQNSVKKDLHQALRHSPFPFTIKMVEECFANTKSKTGEPITTQTTKEGDIAMTENLNSEIAASGANQSSNEAEFPSN
ncbi:unnamed protein product [Linum trigynum]|uniref:CCHC-type domain-containing protein n=1 Tax=Linum trigynum TaxID=586398 RepID=A0AAV2CN89_9ROSI